MRSGRTGLGLCIIGLYCLISMSKIYIPDTSKKNKNKKEKNNKDEKNAFDGNIWTPI